MTDTMQILDRLAKDFPSPKSELHFENAFQLLVAVILSAQCTDKRVNLITPALFACAPRRKKHGGNAGGKVGAAYPLLRLLPQQGKVSQRMSQDLLTGFGGQVPDSIEQLRTLAGVGRKTANVVYAVAFGGQAIAVDTTYSEFPTGWA